MIRGLHKDNPKIKITDDWFIWRLKEDKEDFKMASKVESDDKKTILNVLNKMSNPKELKDRDGKTPSRAAQSFGPDVS